MLGAKTTCKDRWRQVLTEAIKIPHKHLFTLETATECLKLIKEGTRTKDLCLKYKCSKPTIADLKFGRRWKDIPRDYSDPIVYSVSPKTLNVSTA
jgi:hypothetical protein